MTSRHSCGGLCVQGIAVPVYIQVLTTLLTNFTRESPCGMTSSISGFPRMSRYRNFPRMSRYSCFSFLVNVNIQTHFQLEKHIVFHQMIDLPIYRFHKMKPNKTPMNHRCPTEAKLPTHCGSEQSLTRHSVTTSRACSALHHNMETI